MNDRNVSKAALAAIFCICAPGLARADVLSDAQNVKSVYQGHFEIDAGNPESVVIETLMTNQLVTLRLTSKSLNTTAFDAMGLPPNAGGGASKKNCAPGSRDSGCPGASIVPVHFSQFQVWIDGCNVSSQIATLCNSSNCWLTNPSTAHSVDPAGPTASLSSGGSDFSMAAPIQLNLIDVTSCPQGTFGGILDDKKYEVAFKEAGAAGGRVDYEIDIPNQTVTPTRRTHVGPKK